LHGFLGGCLIIVSETRGEIVNGNIVSQLSFKVSCFHLKSGYDVFAVG
jgi:hypothetical protein